MFEKNQKVMYLASKKNVEATVMNYGSTLTSIMIFNKDFDNGRPNIMNVDNNDIVDIETYIANKRDDKINTILNDIKEPFKL